MSLSECPAISIFRTSRSVFTVMEVTLLSNFVQSAVPSLANPRKQLLMPTYALSIIVLNLRALIDIGKAIIL